MKNILVKKINKVQEKLDFVFNCTIGTMIELPSAALNSQSIGEHADFFSFGTNDLTQTTLGLSRDDASKFLSKYIENDIFSVETLNNKTWVSYGNYTEYFNPYPLKFSGLSNYDENLNSWFNIAKDSIPEQAVNLNNISNGSSLY